MAIASVALELESSVRRNKGPTLRKFGPVVYLRDNYHQMWFEVRDFLSSEVYPVLDNPWVGVYQES